MPTPTSGGYALIAAVPRQDPSSPAVGRTVDRLRAELPPGSLIGGAVPENHDLQGALSAKTPLVLGVVIGLGFLLLLIALQHLTPLMSRGRHTGRRFRALRTPRLALVGRPLGGKSPQI